MDKSAETGGLWLLSIYSLLVIASVFIAIGALFTAERLIPSLSEAIFVTTLSAALIGPWFVAVWITDKMAMIGAVGAGTVRGRASR